MIVPDANLLVFAYHDESPFHAEARRRWEDLVDGDEIIGIPWVVATAFIRLIGGTIAMNQPMSPATVVQQVRQWFDYDHIVPLNPGEHHLAYLEQCLAITGATGSLATDAHIAALALENGAAVHTHNVRDFQRFPGLLWQNPLG